MGKKESLSNKIRFYHYASGVLITQTEDPLCSKCKALTNTTRAVREGFREFEQKHTGELVDIDDELRLVLAKTRKSLAELISPENAQGQKKAGKCKMPEGVCFIKSSKSILDKIE